MNSGLPAGFPRTERPPRASSQRNRTRMWPWRRRRRGGKYFRAARPARSSAGLKRAYMGARLEPSARRADMRETITVTILVAEDHVKLDVELPWLLAKLVKVITPAIKKEGTLMLEKK